MNGFAWLTESALWQRISIALIAGDRWKLYLQGLGNTLLIAAVSCVIGIAIGLLVSIVKYSAIGKKTAGWKVANWFANLYTTVIRGTPVVVQLLIIYSITVWTVGLYACMIGFGINSGAYVSEIIRSGINSVDIGQTEAGRSLGLGKSATMRLIVLPQAVKNILPALFNEFISLVKETSVAGYIAVRDLTKAADLIKGRIFNVVPLFIAAACYLVIVLGLTRVQVAMERRLAKSDRG